MERAYSKASQNQKESFRVDGITPEEYQVLNSKKRIRWRFKPRSIGSLLTWGLTLFVFCRLILFPFVEGVSIYFTKTRELSKLQSRYKVLNQQLLKLRQTRDYMRTDAYVEERGHQIGMIKSNESQMVIVDSPGSGTKPGQLSNPKTEVNPE